VNDVLVRPMSVQDVPAVVELLGRALGPAPGGVDRRALFEWKHLGNPFGRSLALVAELDGAVVGFRSFMRWRFVAPDGKVVSAVRAVDTATSPDVQRRGIFTRLTREALEACAGEGVAFVFNTPNARSLPGYLKLGWYEVARWPMRIRVRRPLRLLATALRRDLRSGPSLDPPAGSPMVPAAEALARDDVARVVDASPRPVGWLYTPRSMLYLKWRYAGGPLAYRALVAGEPAGALAMVRIRGRGRAREAVVVEVLWAPGSRALVPGLLRRLPAAAGADHAIAHAGPGWDVDGDLAAARYRRVRRAAMAFTARLVAPAAAWAGGGGPGWSPLDPGSWSLTLGDLEVF
jgi:GNAT superfamily N-acetyltransferase